MGQFCRFHGTPASHKAFSFRGGGFAPGPPPGALPVDTARGSAPRPPCSPCVSHLSWFPLVLEGWIKHWAHVWYRPYRLIGYLWNAAGVLNTILGRFTKLSLWFVFLDISCRVCDCMEDWPESLESQWINRGQGGRTSVEQRLQTLRVEQTDTFIGCITRQRVQELRLVDELPREILKTARQLIDENLLFLLIALLGRTKDTVHTRARYYHEENHLQRDSAVTILTHCIRFRLG